MSNKPVFRVKAPTVYVWIAMVSLVVLAIATRDLGQVGIALYFYVLGALLISSAWREADARRRAQQRVLQQIDVGLWRQSKRKAVRR